MIIYNNAGGRILDVKVDDNSYRYRAIMGDNNLTLYFALAEHIEIPLGAYCDFQGERYTLMRPEALKMRHSRYFEYTVTMESAQAKSKIWKFRNPVDGRLKFSLTAKPHEHLQMFVDNMNRRDTGWSVGSYVDAAEKCISYDHDWCWDALCRMADEFNTEFEIKGKTVSLRKVEYNKSNPLALSYGRGKGFKPDVGRANYGDTPPIEVLYAQGGTRNIDPSSYGSSDLHLPINSTIGFDGEKFEDEDGFNSESARYYITDDLGMCIRRSDKPLSSLSEDSLDCSEIYPKRVGKVTQVIEKVADNPNFYDFIDATIPQNLDYEKYLIEGETMTVVFQSGMLAGREFDVKYYHEATSAKFGRRFEIVPQEIDGQMMPNDTFKPSAVNGGDEYIVYNCSLPTEYINAHIQPTDPKEGAEWDMFRQAVKYLYDHEEQDFSFSGTLDGIWAKKDWVNIGGRLLLGGYILFSDDRFQKEGVRVRITGIKDYVNNPHSPELELSNSTVTGSVSGSIKTLESQEVIFEENTHSAIQFTKRRWRDAKETINLLGDALLDNFSNSINPITIETMQVLVGDESLQFRFVDDTSTPQQVLHQVTYDNEAKTLHADAGILQHLTLDPAKKDLTSERKPEDYQYWFFEEFTSAVLDNSSQAYYLYAKCSKTDSSGEFVLSPTAIKMEAVAGFYHFLMGVLNSEYDGERSYASLYGFTEILPSRITTDRIVSGDGNSWFDMVANSMKLGDALDFNSDGFGTLRLKGTIIQSQSGDENYLGCYRGIWQPTLTYFPGDEVSYQHNDCWSTYRQISSVSCTGVEPTVTAYWQVIAQGQIGPQGPQGIDGLSPNTSFKSFVFLRSNTAPTKPTGGSYSSPVPTGWSDGVPTGEAKLWMSSRIFSSDGLAPQQSEWTTPRQMTDTADFDVEYSSDENPSEPSGHPNTTSGWSNEADDTTIWMAISKKSNGVWSDWQVSRIKGENGQDGTSIHVKGTLSSESELPTPPDDPSDCYIIGQNLWVWDGDSWVNAGQFKGDKGNDGTNGKNAYVHIKFAKSLTTNDWSDNNGESPDKYIGIYTDNQAADRLVWSLYQWSKWQGDDGFGYEYIYKRTTTASAPTTPTDAAVQSDDYVPSGWTDDPSGVTESAQFEWVCYRKKTDGQWGKFIGSSADNTKAALWAKYGSDGVSYVGATEYYQWHTSGTSEPTGEWTADTVPTQPDTSYRFLWNYERISLSDGSYTDTPKHVVGSDGKGIKSFSEYYMATSSGTNAPVAGSALWQTAIPSLTAAKPFLWNKEVVTYTDNTTSTNIHLIAQRGSNGSNGSDGGYTELRFHVSGSTTSAQCAYEKDDPEPSGWSVETPTVSLGYCLWMITARKDADGNLETSWSDPVRVTGEKGNRGAVGPQGPKGENGKSPAMVFRGEYSPTAVYYGNEYRLDCVKYGSQYFIANITVGSFQNQTPSSDSAYWNAFGASFESVATQILLAEYANIAGWIFKKDDEDDAGFLMSQTGSVNNVESSDYMNANFVPHIKLDAINGVIKQGKNVTIDKDGITLLNSNGYIAAKIVNSSIGSEVDLASQNGSFTTLVNRTYSGFMGYSYSKTETLVHDFELQYMNKLSRIYFNQMKVSFTVPKAYSDDATSGTEYTLTWYNVQVSVQLLCNNVVKKTLGSVSAGNLSSGSNFSQTFSDVQNITIDGTTYPEGKYILRVRIDVAQNACSSNKAYFSTSVSITPNFRYAKEGFKKTLIGNDGMFSCWGDNVYLFSSAGGFKVRYGSYMLSVDSSGIRGSKNGGDSWTDLTL